MSFPTVCVQYLLGVMLQVGAVRLNVRDCGIGGNVIVPPGG